MDNDIHILGISAINAVFVDAYLVDDSNHLLFLSAWGRDTAIQEFLARLSLPASENGIKDFTLAGDGIRQFVQVPSLDAFEKVTAKTSHDTETEFGQLTQLWLYDRLSTCPDRANRRALMIYHQSIQPDPWVLVKTICPVPLLDHWRDSILHCFTQQQWIRSLGRSHGVGGIAIDLGEDIETVITQMVRNCELVLSTKD